MKYLIFLASLLLSCTPRPRPPAQTTFYAYRFEPPAFVEFSSFFQSIKEIPFSIGRDCGLLDVYSPPVGKYLSIELSCPFGQTVLFLDTDSGAAMQPVAETDSHFLAWANDGMSAYLKVDSLGRARAVRIYTNGKQEEIDIPGWTYDLSIKPNSENFTFTFSGGLGTGSELNFSKNHGFRIERLYADKDSYISFARYSPDGTQIAFIKIPDSATPFTVGELWVMNADGSNARKLADVDAGHGYAANWSPDGSQIAFVKRENTDDESANQSPALLMSNIYQVNVQSGVVTQITHLANGHAETPHWSPDWNTLAFNVVLDGRMDVQIADILSGQIRSLVTEPTCCPAWMRK